jgi:hypothetical protein
VEVSELTVPQILDNVLRNSPLSYQLLANHLIVITPRALPRHPDAPEDIRITGRICRPRAIPWPAQRCISKAARPAPAPTAPDITILMAPDDATLVVSYVGYETQEIAVGSRTRIDVTLTSASRQHQ